jgi:hypothetical protein
MKPTHWLNLLSGRKSQQRPIRNRTSRLEVVLLEDRLVPDTGYRPIDEVGNNVANPTWGTAGSDLIRLTPAEYADGVSSPSLPQDASPREISDILNNQADPADPSQDIATVNQQSLSDFAYSFGQFMDHDMDLTLDNGASAPISVPAGDPIGGSSDTPLAFNLSQTDPATGTGPGNPAQDVNSITSYLDLSQVYGSDLATDNALRTFVGGQMKTSPGGLPPLDNTTYFTTAQLAQINASVGGMANSGSLPETSLFVTGDTRGNENIELTVLQTLFLDNHNLIASELQQENPTWTDEQLFQEARKLNIAEYQSIIYNEYLPDLLGPSALATYTGYHPNVNASIANEFSTVAFRFGHSLLSGNVERQGNDGQAVAADIPLADDFFDSTILNGEGQPTTTDPVTGLTTTDIGAVLKGDADGDAQAEDTQVINEVRELLFNEVVPGVGGGQDLISLDIERGRVNGIGSYNQVRVALGLPAVTSFAQITSNVQVQQELQEAYGNVNNIDAFEGGLAEDPVPGSDVGPLFQTIMVDQFTNLRDGDRFFYLNEQFSPSEEAILQGGNTLAKVIESNTDITNLQSDVFVFQASIIGTVSLPPSVATPGSGASKIPGPQGPAVKTGPGGVAGITVHLEDTSGDILATTVTNNQGQYTFNQLSGPATNPEDTSGVSGTGSYEIDLVLPSGFDQTSPVPSPIMISAGDTNISGVNFDISIPPLVVSGPANGTAMLYGANPQEPGHYNSQPFTTISPFGDIDISIRTFVADVNGDGVPDIICVTGPGTPLRVAVVSGVGDTLLVPPFDPFGGNFMGGGYVTAADFQHSGRADFVVTPDQGGGPRVSIFALNADGSVTTEANFYGIDDPNFRGGAVPAAGDINGDGTPDLIVAAGYGGGPRITIFDGTTLFDSSPTVMANFFAFPEDASTLRTGLCIAVGDVNGDGYADIIIGGSAGAGPRVEILSGQMIATGTISSAVNNPLANFFVGGNTNDRGGVTVATKMTADGEANVVVGSGDGDPSSVRIYDANTITPNGEPTGFQMINPYGMALSDGVYVG